MKYRKKITHPKFLALMPKGRRLQESGFTLVELIVVITILAILGTIAFISLQGYSRDARDSIRISDLSTMKISLELFNLDAGKYPTTTDGFTVTYSGSEIWTQGEFGDTTTSSVDRLDEIPSDPLTEIKYTYSTTINRQEFQLAGLVEGSDLGFNGILSEANAGDTVATAIVTGNYNGMMLKTSTGGTNCAVLALPSIISNQGNGVTDVVEILTNTGLVYNGYNNIPSNYIGSKYKVDEGFEFVGNNLEAYSDSDSCSDLYSSKEVGTTARIELITGLQNSYIGTIIENEGVINNITTITGDDAIIALSSVLVNNSLGGELVFNNDLVDLSPPVNGLIAHFPLKNDTNDISGNGYNGTVIKSVSYGSGIILNNSSYVTFPSDVHPKNSPSTVSWWIKFTSYDSNSHSLMMLNNYFSLTQNSNGAGGYALKYGLGSTYLDGFSPIIGEWNHFVATQDGITTTLTKNGILIMSFTSGYNDSSGNASQADIALGFYYSGYTSPSELLNVRVYDRVITNNEINNIYNAEKGYFGF